MGGLRRVLIANRGEIAVRVIRACRELGISPVAVCSEADRAALHVELADEVVVLGPAPARESYLRGERVVEAALRVGADAVHPGYGFLSENEGFARAVVDAGLVWVGPSPDVIAAMGSKTASRRTMEAAGVPVIPGYHGADLSPERLRVEAERVGWPLLVKAAFGGGGKGMRVVRSAAELDEALHAARREAEGAFGDGTVYLERYLEGPRHIEVQVLGDLHGNVVHLYERECSLQRRHQKVVEESPSPVLSGEQRERICEAGLAAARAVGYTSAGTVEMILDRGGEFYFLEMNTRLQVEHPVTELVTGVDLVVAQLRIAGGEPLAWTQEQIRQRGHAIECRLYAEDPETGFLPSTGTLLRYAAPAGPGIRHDGGVREGDEVMVHYDPMLAKLCAWGEDREAATARMLAALEQTVVHGVRTNVSFLRHLVGSEAFAGADFHTSFIDAEYGDRFRAADLVGDDALIAAAVAEAMGSERVATPLGVTAAAETPWTRLAGWRNI
ncbi:MAG: acetyl-CoA carboxylase biotin carboxylase subunit [Myxococcales bacterium]